MHRLELTNKDLLEIEAQFTKAYALPYGETPWVKIGHVATQAYAYLSNTLLIAAYSGRAKQLQDMDFIDYLEKYTDEDPVLVDFSVSTGEG